MKNKLVSGFIIGTFVMLYVLVSLISTIHVIDFFELSNPRGMAIALAVAFEIGAAASLASLITLDKMNKTLVWALFIAITAMQMQGNMYYAFLNLESYETWAELFNLIEEEPLFQKRVLAFVSGAILPLVALGFIKSLVDYIKPSDEYFEDIVDKVEDMRGVVNAYDSLQDEIESHVVEQPTKEEREQILADMVSRDEELGLYDDWDATLNDGLEDEELFDEDHALDQVMNAMVEDLEEEDLVDSGYMVEEKQKDAIDLVNSKEANQNKMPKKDLDASFKFGKNLYDTMVKKANTDHLQVDSKPSQEQITQAYRNLGLVNKRK